MYFHCLEYHNTIDVGVGRKYRSKVKDYIEGRRSEMEEK